MVRVSIEGEGYLDKRVDYDVNEDEKHHDD